MKLKKCWVIYTDEHMLDSVWANETSAKQYIKAQEAKDPRTELWAWEHPLNDWSTT